MLTVHHLRKSQSERIVWLCEELDVAYDLRLYARDPVTSLAPAEYKALHPMGTAPVITDDGGVTLAETGAIIEYILARHGGGALAISPGAQDYPAYVYWLHFAQGTMVPTEMLAMVTSIMGGDAGRIAPLMARRMLAFAMIERRLGEEPYFAGQALTAADIAMVFGLTTMRYFVPFDLSSYPAIRAYLARIGERPAYRRAMAKGDPDVPPLLD
ncbi:MAG: glutathione S-transferase family protein [Sphingobium sp.]